MDFNLFDNERPNTDPFTGEKPGMLKQAGLGLMRGGVKAAKGAALLASPFFPSEGDDGPDPDRIMPRREDFFRFIDERLEPAEKFWTPDPASTTTAGKVVGALAELPLQLVSGMPGIAGSVTANTGIQLVDQGVDTGTAAGVAAGVGLATTAMAGLPQAGATPLKTALLAALNPATGAVTDLAAREALQAQGYDTQSAMFDPLDPAARSVDLALGVVFGGVAHYGRWRQTAPTDVVDAIDTVERRKQAAASNPFQPETAEAKAHGDALGGALDALDEGRPVDVAEQLTGPRSPVPKSYTAESFRNDIKEVFGVSDEQADATLALAAARARVQGVELDAWIEKNLKAVRSGNDMGAELFQSRPLVKPFFSKVLAEVEGLQQEKWSGPELLAKLRKTPGVKEEKLAFTGLDEFLTGQKRVTKEDVWSFLSDNQVRVEEVVKEAGTGDRGPGTGETKYDSYVVPGGENYRELLLTLPDAQKPYRSGHFEEENILAHVRFNERTGGAGERILHLEEVQSDWHQARRAGKDVPDAPFAKSWHELTMKRMLRWAAENGFDRLTWTTGEQQADRYDISKLMEVVRYDYKEGQYKITGQTKGGNYKEFGTFTEKELPEAVGKEMAGKMIENRNAGRDYEVYSGLALKMGGEGMKGFYDKILPTYMEKFGRKFGARVENANLADAGSIGSYRIAEFSSGWLLVDTSVSPSRTIQKFTNEAEAVQALKNIKNVSVHSLPITDTMRDALLYEGQPLFQADKGAVSFLADGRAVIHALEAPDFSTVVHEVGHVFEKSLTKAERHEFDTWMHSQVPGTKWSVQQREHFARAFERYLAEGKAPVKDLQGVFDKFRQWLVTIYQRITGTAIDVKINDQVRAAFDRMLFADKPDPETARVQGEMQARVAELRQEMRDIWGDEEAGTGDRGPGTGENLEEAGARGQGPGAGEIVMDAEPADGQAKIETAADIILKERGDFELHDGTNADGTPRLRSATEMLNEARDAVAIEQQRRPLYQRAAVCLGLG